MVKKKLVLFASGGGTNAEQIMHYFQHTEDVLVEKIICNNPKAGVIEKAAKYKVPVVIVSKEQTQDGVFLNKHCQNADLIILAGYLKKIPETLISFFPNKIVNIHPSLLPKYGGKGMYGENVHKAVLQNADKETGITIHYVNENFDEGQIIAQFRTALSSTDNLDTVKQKIQFLEHNYFSVVIATLLKQ